MIHIEGMGWLGAATAFRLAAEGIPFTWNDTDVPHVAWRASAGMVWPAGDDRSRINLTRWADLTGIFPIRTVMPAAYAYSHPNPPHAGTYRPRADLGWVRLANAHAYAVDVPAIVARARARFADFRTTAPEPGQPVIVAHGHTDRRGSWVWGWTVPVQLVLPPDLLHAAHGLPVALYGRAHRFHAAVAYPIPSRPGWWLAGSAWMPQRTPRPLDISHHIGLWRRQASAQYPQVRITACEAPIHGWRPKPRHRDTGEVHDTGRHLIYPPLATSGVRWAPTLLDTAAHWAAARTRVMV